MPSPSSRSASPASDIAAALGERAEAVCRRYLPQGRKQGRYWVAGDLEGARGRSLFVRLHGPGVPGKWTDAATGSTATCSISSGIARARPRSARRSPRPGPSSPCRLRRRRARATTQRKRPAAYGGVAAPSTAPGPRPISRPRLAHCRFPALRFHPELRYREGSFLRCFPALVAAVTGDDGAIHGVQRTWLDPQSPARADVVTPRKALGRIHGRAVRFGRPDATLLVGEGIETVDRHRGSRGRRPLCRPEASGPSSRPRGYPAGHCPGQRSRGGAPPSAWPGGAPGTAWPTSSRSSISTIRLVAIGPRGPSALYPVPLAMTGQEREREEPGEG